ncbi:hypothetical protein ADUPG1_010104 [Aduncisulcus paluster]|uniref:Uncharacterized protein n=1 Tax=Aduncisulcus paluster TaxID=2918883 RepID=A0ABQ5L1R0_9EUKA|nr:hypothetical protein ADUPG1_010104 [Aduncisulcus paluster]
MGYGENFAVWISRIFIISCVIQFSTSLIRSKPRSIQEFLLNPSFQYIFIIAVIYLCNPIVFTVIREEDVIFTPNIDFQDDSQDSSQKSSSSFFANIFKKSPDPPQDLSSNSIDSQVEQPISLPHCSLTSKPHHLLPPMSLVMSIVLITLLQTLIFLPSSSLNFSSFLLGRGRSNSDKSKFQKPKNRTFTAHSPDKDIEETIDSFANFSSLDSPSTVNPDGEIEHSDDDGSDVSLLEQWTTSHSELWQDAIAALECILPFELAMNGLSCTWKECGASSEVGAMWRVCGLRKTKSLGNNGSSPSVTPSGSSPIGSDISPSSPRSSLPSSIPAASSHPFLSFISSLIFLFLRWCISPSLQSLSGQMGDWIHQFADSHNIPVISVIASLMKWVAGIIFEYITRTSNHEEVEEDSEESEKSPETIDIVNSTPALKTKLHKRPLEFEDDD